MNLYRAVSRSSFVADKKHYGFVNSIRIPKNVPYVVDNLWEWLRPDHMPSRRYAIYASPSIELALWNASAGDGDFVACKINFDRSKVKVAQLMVEDARNHPDIRLLSNIISGYGSVMANASFEKRRDIGILFTPGISREDLNLLRTSVIEVNEICREFAQKSTFWNEAAMDIFEHSGEVFFELLDGSFYTLEIA